MAPAVSEGGRSVLSALSLSVLASSGWYIVDYSQIDGDAPYGKGECSIATDFCRDWPTPYGECNSALSDPRNVCTFDRKG